MVAHNRFVLLNQEVNLSAPTAWNDSRQPLLLRYHLHYFDDLNAQDADRRSAWHRELIGRWVRECPPGSFPGWEPYPTSLRIVNWIKWAWRGHALEPAWLDSLATQAAWLARNVEYDILGNHLLANAKALCFAGLFFKGEQADRWLRRGEAILYDQLPKQILADGGHDERSPAYHALVLNDLLELAQAWRQVGIKPPDFVMNPVPKMLRWLRMMSHPDGCAAFFNDATGGQAPTWRHLQQKAAATGVQADAEELLPACVDLAASGYLRLTRGSMVVLADAAPVGSEAQPGHAHADSLSFECSLDGQRIIVNSGISCYGNGFKRQWQRSTAAHSTIAVDEADSSEVWGGFRLARRAYIINRGAREEDGQVMAWGAHDGYRRLGGVGVHRRAWLLSDTELRIEDRVEGVGEHRLVCRFYLHPEISVQREGKVLHLMVGGNRVAWLHVDYPSAMQVINAEYYPAFGRVEQNRCVVVEGDFPLPFVLTTTLGWE